MGAGEGGASERTPLPPQASEELLREHYAELHERPFYNRLVKYMGSGPVVAMVSAGGGKACWTAPWTLLHRPLSTDPVYRYGRGWTS